MERDRMRSYSSDVGSRSCEAQREGPGLVWGECYLELAIAHSGGIDGLFLGIDFACSSDWTSERDVNIWRGLAIQFHDPKNDLVAVFRFLQGKHTHSRMSRASYRMC